MDFVILPMAVQQINRDLMELFGIDSDGGGAIWRVSWSNDQYEKRLTDHTEKGVQLIHAEVRNMPKYSWIKDRWILERLCLVPDVNVGDLPSERKSYECMWKFENAYTGEALPPNLQVAKFVVDTVYAAMGKSSMAKYVDEEAKNPIESREKRINALQEELFGDESSLLGRTITGEAVAYTGEPKIKASQETQ